jgi:hypothetical protein
MKFSSLFKTLLISLLLSAGNSFGQSGSIYISNLYGDYGTGSEGVGDSIAAGVRVTWFLNIDNQTGDFLIAFNHGFRVYSPDGATWPPLGTGATGIDRIAGIFELYIAAGGESFLYAAPTNVGSGVLGDTVGIGVFDYRESLGFPSGFNAPAIKINIANPGVTGVNGSNLCIDRSGYQVNDVWLWALKFGGQDSPVWGPLPSGYGGPQCYTVYNCCTGTRGDTNGDGSALPDIQDLNFLVNYIFRSGQLSVCPTEGDANSDGLPLPNILDLNFLVNYIFREGPTPGSC